MSGQKSDLSASKYGYDLVVATTQASINVTMKEFLSGLDSSDFNACYQWDDNDNCIPLDYSQVLTATGGVDPYTIPNAPEHATDPKVAALDNLGFAFAFKASFGLPSGIDPSDPNLYIIKLDRGNSFVTYQLYCATFAILVLDEHHHNLSWTNISQPDDQPWIFKFNVNLDLRSGNDYFGKLPPAVQQKVKDLDSSTAFSVQQLYLDLNTAGLQDLPDIEGLNPSSPAYEPLKQVFIDTYWRNAKKNGNPLLGYTIQPVTPSPLKPSITPTDLNIEVSPNLDAQGNPTGTYDLYTLNYLVMAQNHPMPAPVQFDWNWIDAAEQQDADGIISINRNAFANYLQGLVNEDVYYLSKDTLVDLRHSGETFSVHFSYQNAANPGTFVPVDAPAAGSDGFTSGLSLSFEHTSHDDSEVSSHTASIHGDFNYTLNGDVAFKGNVMRLTLHAIAYIQFNTHEAGVVYDHLDGNYFDLTQTVTYTLAITDQGQIVTTSTDASHDNSDAFNWHKGGVWDISGALETIQGVMDDIKTKVGNTVTQAFKNYEDRLTQLINHSHAWVYPGGKTFSYKDVYFSDFQDLVTHVTYVDPS